MPYNPIHCIRSSRLKFFSVMLRTSGAKQSERLSSLSLPIILYPEMSFRVLAAYAKYGGQGQEWENVAAHV